MTLNLQVLAQNRNALLLAEVAAWLHMFGKFHEGFLRGEHNLDIQIPPDLVQSYSLLGNLLQQDWTSQVWKCLGIPELGAEGLSIFSLIEKHRTINAPTGLQRLMQDAHGRGSGTEKGALERFFPEQEETVFLSTSLGYEPSQPIDLEMLKCKRQKLYQFLEEKIQVLSNSYNSVNWRDFRGEFIDMMKVFCLSVADTRRPINDVTVFDQTAASVAFFKAALAQNLLLGWYEPKQKDVSQKYHWRILRVGLNGLEFLGKAARVSDLLARKELFKNVLDEVRQLLEVEYPLGMEVYRDENGSLFIVPDAANLLDAQADGWPLRNRLQEIAKDKLNLEASFTLELSERTRNMLLFGRLVAQETPSPAPSPEWLQDLEQDWKDQDKELCTVCGLHPQGPGSKALSRNVCNACEQRRKDRSKTWLQNLDTTIWIDEIADNNGKLALIVGRFGVETWLTGEALSTVVSFEPSRHKVKGTKKKQTFEFEFDYSNFLQDIKRLLDSKGRIDTSTLLDKLLPEDYQRVGDTFIETYDFYVGDSDLSRPNRETHLFALALMRQQPSPARLRRVWETTRAFWQAVLPTDGAADRQQSLVGQNVRWPEMRLVIVPQNGVPRGVVPHHTYDLIVNNVAVSVVWDGQRFLTADNLDYLAKPEQLGQPLTQCLIQGKAYAIEEPAGYGAKNKRLGEITIGEVKEERTSYLPAIPILAEPRTFMALVPADRALQIVQAIKCKYESEMGKVRNRLPLTLGVIYFGRRTPLAAALEAGRRMLRRQSRPGTWTIESVENLDCLPDGWPRCVALTLSDGTRSIRLKISTVMGDKETKDVWYPYWRLEGGDTQGRQRWFKGADDGTWVHVCDLRPGDRVQFMPSTFDYEYLDTTARRFEIFYGEDGQRRGEDKPQRPYLLEEVSEIQSVWQALGRLKKSQIYQIEASIEAKRRAWNKPRGRQALELPSEDVFRRFVQDVLREAETYSESLEKAALSGMLSDALELYLTIAKEEVDHDK